MKKFRILILILFLLSAAGLGASTVYHTLNDDKTIPVIQCPQEPLVLSVGENNTEKLLEGVTAWDEKDGDLTGSILIQGTSGTISGSETTITYAVVDSDDHVATASRVVQYSDYTPPRFGLEGELRYSVGNVIRVKDRLTAYDVVDGDISDRIKISSNTSMVTGMEGTYPMTFEVTNSLGDTASITLDVVVRNYAAGEPIIRLKQYLVYRTADQYFDAMSYVESVSGGQAEEVSVTYPPGGLTDGLCQVTYTCTGPSGIQGSATLYVVTE